MMDFEPKQARLVNSVLTHFGAALTPWTLADMTSETVEKRLQNLEEICAHQTTEIESLSDTVREQWEQIDGLTKTIMRLRDRLTEVEEAGGGPHENTKPPHY